MTLNSSFCYSGLYGDYTFPTKFGVLSIQFEEDRNVCLKDSFIKNRWKKIRKSGDYLKTLHTWAFVLLCLIPIPVYTLAETPFENVKILLRGNLRIMSSLSTPENEGLLYSLILFLFSWQEKDGSVLPVHREKNKSL